MNHQGREGFMTAHRKSAARLTGREGISTEGGPGGTSNRDRFAALPLRQRKFAQTKLGLLNAATDEMNRMPFELILVKNLCRAAGISDASFFNYFQKKVDLIIYYIGLWSLEMGWHAGRVAATRGGLAAVEEIFALTARRAARQPRLMAEIIVQQARMSEPKKPAEITPAERLLAFPDLEGIEEVGASGLEQLLPPLLERAVRSGDLPRSMDRDAAMIAIASVFFGTPVTVRSFGMDTLESWYRKQLNIVWKGLRGRKKGEQHG